MPHSYDEVKVVKEAHEDALMQKKNVVGVGIGLQHQGGAYTSEIALVVMVTEKVPAEQLSPEDIIPREIDGIPVDVQEVGDIRAL